MESETFIKKNYNRSRGLSNRPYFLALMSTFAQLEESALANVTRIIFPSKCQYWAMVIIHTVGSSYMKALDHSVAFLEKTKTMYSYSPTSNL
mmetsp:Transcript_20003/g.42920  ORF Transcript_20003/g.42920 Transcript_20003/m.42920 type:complete len:92 (-) Transcript_20003:272-547(-)